MGRMESTEIPRWHAIGMARSVRTGALLFFSALALAACGACGGSAGRADTTPPPSPSPPGSAKFPLKLVADVDLPGASNRFDYQDIDPAKGYLVIAHMNDASVVVTKLSDGSVVKVLPNMTTARGVIAADDVGRIFVTIQPNLLSILDNGTLAEIKRVGTGKAPDGVGWDPVHRVVGVSDQQDGAISLIPNSGDGTRVQVKLGNETGNVEFDPARAIFWITVNVSPVDQLVGVDPVAAQVTTRIDLPGCGGAHGLRIHPDGKSALIACEDNDMFARVALDGDHAVTTAPTGAGPDVLSVDAGLGLVYVAAESGDLVVFDISKPGLVVADKEHVGDHAHSVAVDPATHRVFFPLLAGPKGTPVLRIMQPGS